MNLENVTILGDVHLGRRFTTGVPIHRLGEREEAVWNQFTLSVHKCETPLHVQVGDLFDAFVVDPTTVLRAAEVYLSAPRNITYVILRGNHDASRDADKRSSFDLFEAIVSGTNNVFVVKDNPQHIGGYGFIPWHPFRSAADQAEILCQLGTHFEAVFGHWDTQSFGGSEHNLIPLKQLKPVTPHIVTGHIHMPQQYEQDGVLITVTGSMQPYSHAEDPTGEWYVTVTREQFENLDTDYRYKNVRVVLDPNDNEPLPDRDCLSLTLKRGEAQAVESIEVDFAEFDLNKLFRSSLEENGVSGEVMDQVLAKLQELRNA